MRTPITLLAMLAGLVALFGVAINLGESIVDGAVPGPNRQSGPRSGGDSNHGTGPGGLAVASQGYVLRPRTTRFIAGETTNFRFTVFTDDGKPVTDFARNHDRRMNLVVVRRDMSGYQHLFPIMAPDGTWSVSLRLDRPGNYRAFAEFLPEPATAPVILGVDLDVPGLVEPVPIPKISSVAEVDDYSVVGTGDLVAGSVSQLWMHVIRDDVPVTDLDTYLGNGGRLVILREGDLAYLQVRPIEGPRRDTTIGFEVEAPSVGYYRMFMEFQHHGQVRTAEFTVLAR
ncbi:MAG TPA: hypothetical protein VK887_09825 [Pseudonocardiaceae bacterium]|nr:hypothetical protein [Pseudonocardiaceae bacterium]